MIYLDNAATTKVDDRIVKYINEHINTLYANPSSPYSFAQNSLSEIERARECCADLIGCSSDEIYFTSGGTESNNLILNSFYMPLVSCVEHHSVLNANENSISCFVDKNGLVDIDKYKRMLNTFRCVDLVSIMHTNNLTGMKNDVKTLSKIAHDNNKLFHCDCTQALGHSEINVKRDGIDFLTASAHKIHGLKGMGMLYVNSKYKNEITPQIKGGKQENGLRAGTENLIGIISFGKACEIAKNDFKENSIYIEKLRDNMIHDLLSNKYIHLVGTIENRTDNNINIIIDGINANQLVYYCDENDICISSTSACDTGDNKPNHVLKAMGYSDEECNSSIRITLSKYNTKEDVRKAAETILDFVDMVHSL